MIIYKDNDLFYAQLQSESQIFEGPVPPLAPPLGMMSGT